LKKTRIGKITIATDKILINANLCIDINILEVKELKITFPTQFGNSYYYWGFINIDSSEENEISFIYNDKAYLYYFSSRDSDDLRALENIIRVWIKKGVQVNYTGPKRRI
jgi:hypothetical protein